jgi:hypothetical protein
MNYDFITKITVFVQNLKDNVYQYCKRDGESKGRD